MWWICLLGLPLAGFFLKRFLWGPGKGKVVYKGATTLVAVAVALFGAVCCGGAAWLGFVGVLLCFVADVWIHFSLIPGVLVFLSAHLCFIGWMLTEGGSFGWNLLLIPVGCALLAVRYWRYLPKLKGTAFFLLIYVMILFSMASVALSFIWEVSETEKMFLIAGAACFVSSDLVLGDSIARERHSDFRDRLVMLLYEPAVFLLALGTFFL